MKLVTLLALVLLWIAYLVVERVRLDRARASVPLRISVTGTRGKTSVTRLLASVLREDGRTVLAKVTGSVPKLILPDGTEREIRRRGQPSIIEQKQLLREGARLGVDVLVAEVMSLHREMHAVETAKLLQPHQVVVTNFRVDHLAAHGDTREEVASVMALDVPPRAQVFVPDAECLAGFEEDVRRRGGRLFRVPEDVAGRPAEEEGDTPTEVGDRTQMYGQAGNRERMRHAGRGARAGPPEVDGSALHVFSRNVDLVRGVCTSLGCSEATIERGIHSARPDIGSFGIWRYPGVDSQASRIVVSAFAANDPESTLLIYDQVAALLQWPPERFVGLLNLRKDRGDRTLQWLDVLRGGSADRFGRIFVIGFHAGAVRRRLLASRRTDNVEVLSAGRPSELMRRVGSGPGKLETVVFGFGNIGGAGRGLVDHWVEVGEPVPQAGVAWPGFGSVGEEEAGGAGGRTSSGI